MLHNLDSDSSKIIEAVRSTGVVITEAMRLYVDYIVSNMKAIGTWQLSSAVYGFVGGTSASHKWNWKDLRDVDAAFRLTFFNSPTHNSSGVLFNGTNQYANTFLNPTTVLANPKTSVSLSAYINGGTGLPAASTFMGAFGNNDADFNNYITALGIRPSSNIGFFESAGEGFAGNVVVYNGSISLNGYLLGNAKDGKVSIWKKTIKLNEVNQNALGLAANGRVFLGTTSNNISSPTGSYQNIRLSLTTIGSGLTDTQAIQQSQIVTNAQLILNRA
jgi:hypothetical protein